MIVGPSKGKAEKYRQDFLKLQEKVVNSHEAISSAMDDFQQRRNAAVTQDSALKKIMFTV